MKRTHGILVKILSVMTAVILQITPLIRSALQAVNQSLAPAGWAVVFRWAAAGAAMFGYDAVSKASSIAISPPNATVGQPYVGTITYSGGHAGSVSSMSFSNLCLSATTAFVDGLTIIYSGGNTAAVSGTPTAAGTFSFTLHIYDSSTCGSGNSDIRSTSLVVGTAGGGAVAPSISSPPQSLTTQVGADALFSAGASGNPTPSYSWYRGLPNIAADLVGTNSTLDLPNVQFTNAGLYTVVASNASGSVSSPAYLSVALTPGANQLALNYTNYYPAGQALTMYSYLTNVPAGSNTYKWQFNSVDITPFSPTGNTLNLTAAQVTPAKTGTYGVVFNSVVGPTTVVNQQLYYSYWAFGLPPAINGPPQSTNVNAGADLVLTATATNVSVPPNLPTLPFYGTNTPLTFQWLFQGTTVLATQTTNGLAATESLVLPSVSAANAGDYTVVVSNYWGSVTSSPALVSVGGGGGGPTVTATLGANGLELGASAAAGQTYVVLTTTNLSSPWTPLATNRVPAGGQLSFTNSITKPKEFFRLEFP